MIDAEEEGSVREYRVTDESGEGGLEAFFEIVAVLFTVLIYLPIRWVYRRWLASRAG